MLPFTSKAFWTGYEFEGAAEPSSIGPNPKVGFRAVMHHAAPAAVQRQQQLVLDQILKKSTREEARKLSGDTSKLSEEACKLRGTTGT